MKKKSFANKMDVEIDLIAFISLLSVCICFLLLTSIWIHISSMNFKQALGGGAAQEATLTPQLWITMQSKGKLVMKLENAGSKVSRNLKRKTIMGDESGQVQMEEIQAYARVLREKLPNLETALLQPNAGTYYEELIKVMDAFRLEGYADLGIAPL